MNCLIYIKPYILIFFNTLRIFLTFTKNEYYTINNFIAYNIVSYYCIIIYAFSRFLLKDVYNDFRNNLYYNYRYNFNIIFILYTHTILINIILNCFENAYITNYIYLTIYTCITFIDLKYFFIKYNEYTNNNRFFIMYIMQYVSIILITTLFSLFTYLNKLNFYIILYMFMYYFILYLSIIYIYNINITIPNENINTDKLCLKLFVCIIYNIIINITFILYFLLSIHCESFRAKNQNTYEFIVLFCVLLNASYCFYINIFFGIINIIKLLRQNTIHNIINNENILENIAIIINPNLEIQIGIPL